MLSLFRLRRLPLLEFETTSASMCRRLRLLGSLEEIGEDALFVDGIKINERLTFFLLWQSYKTAHKPSE